MARGRSLLGFNLWCGTGADPSDVLLLLSSSLNNWPQGRQYTSRFPSPGFPLAVLLPIPHTTFKMLGPRLISGSLAAVAGLASVANADFIRGQAMLTGQATTGGTCSFANYTLPRDIYGVGIGGGNWAGGGKCGSCLDVFGPGGSARVMVRLPSLYLIAMLNSHILPQIVDSCTSCANNRLNLFSDAFRRIAGTDKGGIIDVEFDVVSCDIEDPIVVRNKVGTSRYQ